MDRVQLPRGYSHFKEAVSFYHSVPRNSQIIVIHIIVIHKLMLVLHFLKQDLN